MNWQFDEIRQVHELTEEGGVFAKIYLSEKPKNARPFRARTLISGLYYGNRTLSRLDRSNKEWVTKLKKFRTRDEASAYLERKKTEVQRFLEARECEVEKG